MIKIYVPLTIEPFRRHVFPLLKPFSKKQGYTDERRKERYYISNTDVELVNNMETADYVVLPMSWNFYFSKNRESKVLEVISQAKEGGKRVLSFTTGDYGVKIPFSENLIVFRMSGEKKKLPHTHMGLPSFIDDPLKLHFNTNNIHLLEYTSKPVVGFCGQANNSRINGFKEWLRTGWSNLKSFLGLRKELPQKLISTSLLRARLLQKFQASDKVVADFILRKKYRAGAKTDEDRSRTTQEFYDNLNQSAYVLCVRGVGNFSVRLYETLAMGRIPVYVDTDGLLPHSESINWKEHLVWITADQRNNIVAEVAKFHKGLDADKFEELQRVNRSLWLEKLTLGGFFKYYVESKSNAV